MRFNRRFAVVVGCSLVWALLVSAIFYRVASKAKRGPVTGRGKPMVVAALALPLGATIGPESVKVVEAPESLIPKGGFSRVEDVLQRPVVSPIEPDEPVVESRIGAKGSGVGLAPMIPPGLRAISVRVNDVVGVAGFVLPGMRVDVLVTGRPSGREDMMTNTVLQNIPVLSAGTTIQTDAKSQTISTTVVTLLVTPAQAEALTLSNAEGHIQLVLRNATDNQVGRTPGSQLRELYGLATQSRTAVAPPPAENPPPRPRRSTPETVVPAKTAVLPAVGPARPDEIVMIRGNQKTIEAAPRKMAN